MGNAALLADKRFSESELRGIIHGEKYHTAFKSVSASDGTISKAELLKILRQEPSPGSIVPSALASTAALPFEVIVIGGGPAGAAGCIRAGLLGRRVLLITAPSQPTLVDKASGRDPFLSAPSGLFSKALRDTAKHLSVASLRAQGIADDAIWGIIRHKCLSLAGHNAEHCEKKLLSLNIATVRGFATLKATVTDDQVIDVMVKISSKNQQATEEAGEEPGAVFRAEKVLIATGSSALRLPGVPFDELRVFTCDSICRLAFLPRSVGIVGSGIVALEFARIFAALEAKVTMIVRGSVQTSLARIGLDRDVVDQLIVELRASGVVVLEHTSVKEFRRASLQLQGELGPPLRLALSDGSALNCDCLMVAAGRSPNTSWLEGAGVALGKRGHVLVGGAASSSGDDDATTGNSLQSATRPGVYAAGDVLPPPSPALASSAVEEAERAVCDMLEEASGLGQQDACHSGGTPCGIWTTPEVGFIGFTAEAAAEASVAGRFPEGVVEGVARYDDCLRGRIFAPGGLLKLVIDRRSGRVAGVHIIGADACEIIHFGARLVREGATLESILSESFVAVTFHELFSKAAFDANSKLAFGVQWRRVLNALRDSFQLSSDSDAFCRSLEISIEDGSLRERFNVLDKDGNGSLETDEVFQLVLGLESESSGTRITRGDVANLVRLADENGNGAIDYYEFEAVMRRVAAESKGTTEVSKGN